VCGDEEERRCSPLTLTAADITLHRLPVGALLRRLSDGLGLAAPEFVEAHPWAWRVGVVPRTPTERWPVYFVATPGPDDFAVAVERVVASASGGHLVLAPTGRWWSAGLVERVTGAGGLPLALVDITGLRGTEVIAITNLGALDAGEAPAPSTAANRVWLEGGRWTLIYEGHRVTRPDSAVLCYVAHLLRHPHEEFEYDELIRASRPDIAAIDPDAGVDLDHGERGAELGDAGDLADPLARARYKRRLTEISRLLKGGPDAALEQERDFLRRELNRVEGIGGKARKAKSAGTAASKSVREALRRFVGKLRKEHGGLAAHLDTCIDRRGTIAYRPAIGTRWTA